MKIAPRNILPVVASLLVAVAAFAAFPAVAQPGASQRDEAAQPRMGPQGMGGMMDMTQGCRQMMGGQGMPHLPPGNEKLELQMHAEMMKAMGDILAKYAARLPEKK